MSMHRPPHTFRQPPTRRDFLSQSCNGIGGLALAGMLANELLAAPDSINPLGPREQHLPRKAKHCIFLFMGGGVSHIDTFDYKPALQKYAGKRLPRPEGLSGEVATALDAPHTAMPTLWDFKQHGESGRYVTTLLPNLARHVDELAFIHGIRLDNNNHGPATLHMNTGSQFPGSPSVGSWIQYGLGSPNQNLPGYVVIQDPRGGPTNGSAVWGNGYLPASLPGRPFPLLRPPDSRSGAPGRPFAGAPAQGVRPAQVAQYQAWRTADRCLRLRGPHQRL